MIAPGSRPRLASKARLRWDAKEERWFLLYPERGLALNRTGSAVLELCDGARTVAEIVDALANDEESAARAEIERDVVAFLDELTARGLLVAGGA